MACCNRCMRSFLLFLLVAPLWAQTVSVGVKVGVPFSDPTGPYGESRPYAIGPTIEVRLPAGFAIEGSALYRRIGQTLAFNYRTSLDATAYFVNRQRGNAWEFPIIGKHYFGEHRVQPFVGLGLALRKVWGNDEGSTTTITSGSNLINEPFHISNSTSVNAGATAVAGVRVRAGRISLLPEFRYTRWDQSLNGGNHKNEGGFYLGIRF